MEQDIRFCKTSDGVRIAYASVGQGPPLIRALGWATHLEYEWQSPLWRHFIEALAQNHTLIRYDGRGTGLSDRDVDVADTEEAREIRNSIPTLVRVGWGQDNPGFRAMFATAVVPGASAEQQHWRW